MNERIKELVVQAGITTNLDTDFFEKNPNKWVDYFAEKFAELIIRECLDQIHVADVGDLKAKSYYLDKVAEHIEKHFGIEE